MRYANLLGVFFHLGHIWQISTNFQGIPGNRAFFIKEVKIERSRVEIKVYQRHHQIVRATLRA